MELQQYFWKVSKGNRKKNQRMILIFKYQIQTLTKNSISYDYLMVLFNI